MQAKAAQYIGNKSFKVVEKPIEAPAEDEVRLKVAYVGICGTDMHIYHGLMDHRVQAPQVVGHEMSGVVDAVGEHVSDYSVGDHVVVRPLDYCGDCPACNSGFSHICHNLKFMGVDSEGAFQSYWNVKARTLHKLPQNVSLRQGALVEPLAVACHDISRARLKAGEKAVILGGGPIGQLIAQVALSIGAEVMISEPNSERRAFAIKNGVLAVNPLEQELTAVVNEWTCGKGADVAFEVSGVQPAVDVMTEIAAVRGRICMVAIHSEKPKVDVFKFFWRELELLGARVYEKEDFERAIDLISKEKINLDPFISKVAPLDQIGEAFAGMDGNPSGMKALISCGAVD